MSDKTRRTKEGYDKHVARTVVYKRKRRLDPEYRLKEAKAAAKRYAKNKDKYRIAAREWHELNKEKQNAKRRRWRRANPDLARAEWKKSHAGSIKRAIANFRRGDIGIDELNRRLSETFIRLDERLRSERLIGSNDRLRSGETDSKPGKSKA